MRNRRILAVAAAATLVASACSGSGGGGTDLPTSIGDGEGKLTVLACCFANRA